MNMQWIWRAFPAVIVAFFVMGFAMIGIGAASTPAADRHASSHHTNLTSTNACTESSAGMGAMGGMMSGAPAAASMPGTPMTGSAMGQDFDLMFIDMMIPHHESAVAMAQVALTRGEHQEIRDLAQNVIDRQSAEMAQMQAWRDAWYPDAPVMPMAQMTRMMGDMMMQGAQMPGGMGAHGAGTGYMHTGSGMDMLDPKAAAQSLSATTGPFDQAFIEMMIPHHHGAVSMAEIALGNAIHPEIKRLAQAIIDAQQQEIAQMEKWGAAWYGVAPAASPSGSQTGDNVTVTLSEFAMRASRIDFQAGQTYRFVVTNDGAISHEFMIMPYMADTGQMEMEALDAMALVMIPASDLAPGATRTVEVAFPKTVPDGGFELVCAVPGHYNAGMVLPISVSA